MWQVLAIMLTAIGSIIFYLSNKHQIYLQNPLNKSWRVMGYLLYFLSFVTWLQVFVVSASIFIWIFTISVILILIPILSLNKCVNSLISNKQKRHGL